jgi:hypothetical protein
MATYEARLPRCQKALGVAERRMAGNDILKVSHPWLKMILKN